MSEERIKKRKKIVLTRDEIQTRVEELGAELATIYGGKDIIAISLLRGSFIFAADLVREMPIQLEVDFLTTSSYGYEESSSGDVKVIDTLRSDVKGRDVLIIDDIIDTGRTLSKTVEFLKEKGAKTVHTCVLLDKPSRREVDFEADYIGFNVEDNFIVGYGLNYGPYFRNVPYIYIYEDEE